MTLDRERAVMHVVPALPADDVQHSLDDTCWCQPAREVGPDGGAVVIHRRYMDGPVHDPDDDKGWLVVPE